jgi:hypothetical protein
MALTKPFMLPADIATWRRVRDRHTLDGAHTTQLPESCAFGIRHSTYGTGTRLLFLPLTPFPPVSREAEPV